MRLAFFCFLFISIWYQPLYAQQDSLAKKQNLNIFQFNKHFADSVHNDSVTKENRLQFIADSIGTAALSPGELNQNVLISQLGKDFLFHNGLLTGVPVKAKSFFKSGSPRKARELWVIAAIIGLLIYTALLNIFLSKDVKSVIRSFYDKNALSQMDKEGGPINSWAFIGLFILFSLTCGLVLYQWMQFKNLYSGFAGFQLFIWLSVGVSLLFALKFLVLKFVGFVFDISSVISQYISILNLTYFNIAFVLLFVALCFSLLDAQFIRLLLIFTIGLIVVIFAWQYVRNSVNIISNFRFHKFYLFIYLCALEICPVLILIKALDI